MNDDNTARVLLNEQRTHFYGKYAGLVTENEDTLKRGRLEVQVPQVHGLSKVWALPCVPYAGEGVGFYFLPKINTVVWIEFEAGDPSYPIWTGCAWKPGDIADADAKPTIKFLKTDKFTIRIDDDSGELHVEDQNGNSVVITSSDLTIKSALVKIQGGESKEVEIDKVSVRVNKGALAVT